MLYAENFCLSSLLVFITLGKIYLNILPKKSARNFSINIKDSDSTKNIYNKYFNLPKIKLNNSNESRSGSFKPSPPPINLLLLAVNNPL